MSMVVKIVNVFIIQLSDSSQDIKLRGCVWACYVTSVGMSGSLPQSDQEPG